LEPPADLDGAAVLEWAWSDTGFGFVGSIAIHGLAICKYADASSFYRFACDSQWTVVQDQDHQSALEAKDELPEQYQAERPDWRISARAREELRGTTVNERLFYFGLFPAFDVALSARDNDALTRVLVAAYFSQEQAASTAAAVLQSPPSPYAGDA
jgi:hypothetical protein